MNSVVATPTEGMPLDSRSARSCVQHDVHEPQSASPSITTLTSPTVAKPAPLLLRQQIDPIEKHIASRLGNIEQANGQAVQMLGASQPRARGRAVLGRRIHDETHDFTSLVTGSDPANPPPDQPPMMPENMPAPPPARTINSPPGRNLLRVLPTSDGR